MKRLGMVVLASENLWPNLQGLTHWLEHGGGVSTLFVYFTDDERRSHLPALRLRRLVSRLYKEIKVVLHDSSGTILPEDVERAISQWMKEYPHREWVINVTGGTKLMTAGALGSSDRTGVEIVYRELNGKWYGLSSPKPGRFTSREIQIDESGTERIPVEELVRLQFPSLDQDRWDYDEPSPLPVLDMVRAGVRTDWDWAQVFKAVGAGEASPGFLFEQFVAAVLLELGVRNIVINLKQIQGLGIYRQEVDIVANHRNRLFLIDCKLGPGQNSLIVQFSDLANRVRSFGGLSATGVLLRPERAIAAKTREFGEEYARIKIFGKKQMPELLPELARIFGVPMTESLEQCQAIIEESKSLGIVPYCQGKQRRQAGEKSNTRKQKPRGEVRRKGSTQESPKFHPLSGVVNCIVLHRKTANGAWRLQAQGRNKDYVGLLSPGSSIPDDMAPGKVIKCRVRSSGRGLNTYEYLGNGK